MAQIAIILRASRSTLMSDVLGLAAIAAMTLGLLHLPGFL